MSDAVGRPGGCGLLLLDARNTQGSVRSGSKEEGPCENSTTSSTRPSRQFEAEQALVNGDPELRLAMTSTMDPVTVFGAKVPVRHDGTR